MWGYCVFYFFPQEVHKPFIYLGVWLFVFREREKEKEERNINVCLPLACPLLGTWPATQACALTENRTSDPLGIMYFKLGD